MWDPYAELKEIRLSNGLTLHVGTWDRDWLKVGIVVHSGAKEDLAGKEGTAHFLEHLLINNASPWTPETARRQFEAIGGYCSFGSTYRNATVYTFGVPLDSPSKLEFALNLYSNMLMTARIEREIERERQVIVQEFQKSFGIQFLIDKLLSRRQVLFGTEKLGTFLTSLGTPESVLSITQDDLQSFYDQHYVPQNISLIAVGGLPAQEVARFFQESEFGLPKPGERTPLLPENRQALLPRETRRIYHVNEFSNQPVERSGIESYAALPSALSQKAINRARSVLYDVMHKEIRERRGWTYGFTVSHERFSEAYEFGVSGNFSWEALNLIEDVLDDCVRKATNDTELISHHLRANLAGYGMLDITAGGVMSNSIDDLRGQHSITSIREELDKAKAMKVEDVQEVLHLFRRERRFTSILHP